MKRSHRYLVSMPIVPGVPRFFAALYIKHAIERWADHLPEGNPLRGVFRARERSKVSVRPLP